MKAVIRCSRPSCSWVREFFEDKNPYLLPVLGKPLIEFYLDYCSLCGVSTVLVLMDDFDEELCDFISTGSRWGLDISVGSASIKDEIKNVLAKNTNFISDADTLVYIDGFFFPQYNKNLPKIEYSKESFKRISIEKQGAESILLTPYKEIELNSVKDYFLANINSLKYESKNLFMKGYNAEENVFMGMNDSITKGVNLKPPFVIGDNVQIEVASQIGENAIIGDTCIIDRRTKIINTIVFDNTYIGADLDLNSKIIFGNAMVDPISEIAITFTDNFFTSKIEGSFGLKFIKKIFAKLVASIILLAMLPCFLIFSIFGTPKKKLIKLPNAVKCPKYIHSQKFFNSLFFKLSMDKFIPIFLVLKGDIAFVGDSRFDEETCGKIIKRYKNYAPGAFSYADSLGHTREHEIIIDDLFYRQNRSIKNNLQILLRSFVLRLFASNDTH